MHISGTWVIIAKCVCTYHRLLGEIMVTTETTQNVFCFIQLAAYLMCGSVYGAWTVYVWTEHQRTDEDELLL